LESIGLGFIDLVDKHDRIAIFVALIRLTGKLGSPVLQRHGVPPKILSPLALP
jgi:hypothetical protein